MPETLLLACDVPESRSTEGVSAGQPHNFMLRIEVVSDPNIGLFRDLRRRGFFKCTGVIWSRRLPTDCAIFAFSSAILRRLLSSLACSLLTARFMTIEKYCLKAFFCLLGFDAHLLLVSFSGFGCFEQSMP